MRLKFNQLAGSAATVAVIALFASSSNTADCSTSAADLEERVAALEAWRTTVEARLSAPNVAEASDNEPTPAPSAAEQVVLNYWHANTWMERNRWVWKPSTVRDKMKRQYGRTNLAANPERLAKEVPPLDVRYVGTGLIFVDAYLPTNPDDAARYVLRPTADGPRIDWEASVFYGEFTLESLRSDPCHNPSLVRCIIKPSSYYNFKYRGKESSHYSFDLLNGNYRHMAHAYAQRGKTDLEKMRALAASEPNGIAVIVRIQTGNLDRVGQSVSITEFVQEGFVLGIDLSQR